MEFLESLSNNSPSNPSAQTALPNPKQVCFHYSKKQFAEDAQIDIKIVSKILRFAFEIFPSLKEIRPITYSKLQHFFDSGRPYSKIDLSTAPREFTHLFFRCLSIGGKNPDGIRIAQAILRKDETLVSLIVNVTNFSEVIYVEESEEGTIEFVDKEEFRDFVVKNATLESAKLILQKFRCPYLAIPLAMELEKFDLVIFLGELIDQQLQENILWINEEKALTIKNPAASSNNEYKYSPGFASLVRAILSNDRDRVQILIKKTTITQTHMQIANLINLEISQFLWENFYNSCVLSE